MATHNYQTLLIKGTGISETQLETILKTPSENGTLIKDALENKSFTMVDGQDELRIPFTYAANGLEYVKTFVLKRGSYAIEVEYDVVNKSGNNATLGMYAHLRQNVTTNRIRLF